MKLKKIMIVLWLAVGVFGVFAAPAAADVFNDEGIVVNVEDDGNDGGGEIGNE